jgi:hypothetical protein
LTKEANLKIGYARVSSRQQNASSQIMLLEQEGCHFIKVEKQSGATIQNRPVLQTILEFIQKGNILVVHSLDRLGRNLKETLEIISLLESKGATLKVLNQPLFDTGSPTGKFVIQLLGAVAEMERAQISERRIRGQTASRARGVHQGRPKKIDDQQIRNLKAAGQSAAKIAEELGISRPSVYLALKSPLENAIV